MTKIFKKKSKTLFVSKTDKVIQRGHYSVILSPEFYWVKSVELPVKKERDALRLAASTFEGYLPDGVYSYEVRKESDKRFIMIAYDKKEIANALDKIFLHKKDITDVYFAQDVLSGIDECVAVDSQVALSNMSHVIIKIPRACTKTDKTLNDVLDEATLGNKRVKLSSFDNTFLSMGDVKMISVLAGVLLAAFMTEYVVYKKSLVALDNKRAQLIKEHDLPRTSIQLKSIKKSLSKKFNRQKSLRDLLYSFSQLRLKKGEYIESIEVDSKEMRVKIQILDAKREREIKSYLSRKLKIKESHLDENSLTLRIAV